MAYRNPRVHSVVSRAAAAPYQYVPSPVYTPRSSNQPQQQFLSAYVPPPHRPPPMVVKHIVVGHSSLSGIKSECRSLLSSHICTSVAVDNFYELSKGGGKAVDIVYQLESLLFQNSKVNVAHGVKIFILIGTCNLYDKFDTKVHNTDSEVENSCDQFLRRLLDCVYLPLESKNPKIFIHFVLPRPGVDYSHQNEKGARDIDIWNAYLAHAILKLKHDSGNAFHIVSNEQFTDKSGLAYPHLMGYTHLKSAGLSLLARDVLKVFNLW